MSINSETSNSSGYSKMQSLLIQLDNMVYPYFMGDVILSQEINDINYFVAQHDSYGFIPSCLERNLLFFHELQKDKSLWRIKYDIIDCLEFTHQKDWQIPIFTFKRINNSLELIDINHIIAIFCRSNTLHFKMYEILTECEFEKFYMFDEFNQDIDQRRIVLRVFVSAKDARELIYIFLLAHKKSDPHTKTIVRYASGKKNYSDYSYPNTMRLHMYKNAVYSMLSDKDKICDTRIQIYKEEKFFDDCTSDLYKFTTDININSEYSSINRKLLDQQNLNKSIVIDKISRIARESVVLKNMSSIDEYNIVSYITSNYESEKYDICHILGLYMLDCKFLSSEPDVFKLCEKHTTNIYIEYDREMMNFNNAQYRNLKHTYKNRNIAKKKRVRYLIGKNEMSRLLHDIKTINLDMCLKKIPGFGNCVWENINQQITSRHEMTRLYNIYYGSKIMENHKSLMHELITKTESRQKIMKCILEITEPENNISHNLILTSDKKKKIREILKQFDDIYKNYQNSKF